MNVNESHKSLKNSILQYSRLLLYKNFRKITPRDNIPTRPFQEPLYKAPKAESKDGMY